jgi:tRNA-binding protein
VEVLPFPRARNPSWKVGVEFGGDLGIRWSSAQITSYAPEDLIGTQVCCIVNFAPRNIAGFQSEILILGAPSAQGETILVSPRSTVPEGGALF